MISDTGDRLAKKDNRPDLYIVNHKSKIKLLC